MSLPLSDSSTTSSPLKPDTECKSELPQENAIQLFDPDDDENLTLPTKSECSNEHISGIEPKDFITDEMLAEEKRLYSSGVKEEEQRKKDQEVKEVEEKRRQRVMKRKAKKEQGSKSKRSKTSEEQTPPPKASEGANEDVTESPQDLIKQTDVKEEKSESGSPNEEQQEVKEPGVCEKASTFGVDEEEEERHTANGELIPFLQPKLMVGGVLRQYQIEGYSWLKVLYENGVNGILADEMGLGKTVQCVAILAHLVYMGIPGPFLVCAPLSTIPNWFAEFRRFAPEVPTILYHGHKDTRAKLAKKIHKRHNIRGKVDVQPVVITSYEVAMIDRRYLGNHEWKYLIVDEGHRIKNTHCRLIKSTHRLLLTGTPLQNNLAELWSLLNFLLPEIFDDLCSFEAWFDANAISDSESSEKLVQQERSESVLNMMHQILTPFMLRRLKSDVDLNIPPKKEILVYAPLTQLQREMYSALVDRSILGYLDKKNKVEEKVELNKTGRPKRKSASRVVNYSILMESDQERKARERREGGRRRWKDLEEEEKEIESWVKAVGDFQLKDEEPAKQKTSQVTVKMRNIMMQLRKCCNHPYLLEHPLDPKTGDLALTEEVVTTSGKMLVLDRMLPELKKRGHRVLIFSQMTRLLDLIEDYCQIRKYDFCRLDGATNIEDRKENMEVFNQKFSEKFVFLLSTRAGGLGINLIGADTVIIYDSDWNPQCDLQAQDRCHRIGQTKPVVVYRLITANTIDQKIIERAAAKRKLEKMVIHKGSFKTGNFTTQVKPISAEELQELLQSCDHDSELRRDNFNISKAEMDMLLDRSDLYEKWEKEQKVKGITVSSPLLGKTDGIKPKRIPLKSQTHLFEVEYFKTILLR
ncbi:lymphocyte-specific helicase-like [Plakobranchus ocellatus]|uniref:Proliferation-associated SNF2-like protein n=1 Tax=Plakobranchus ocellatus TaxID=259542 RepID=A0AAV3ZUW2_9GAST|nr:lymphocyte-specific helicase-like [Plakobranchus ocellatus]